MSLLSALNIPPPKLGLPVAATVKAAVSAAQGTRAVPPIVDGKPGAPAAAAFGKDVATLHATMQGQQDQARRLWVLLQDEQNRLAKAIEAANGDRKTILEDQKKDIDKRFDAANTLLRRIDDDVTKLGDPSTPASALALLLAKNKASTVNAVTQMVVQQTRLLEDGLAKSVRTEAKVTMQDGKATIEQRQDSTTLGADGVTQNTTVRREVAGPGGSSARERSDTLQVNADGVKQTGSTKWTRQDAQGNTSSLEHRDELQMGPGGVKQTKVVARTNADGSGNSTSNSRGIETGGGKAMGALGQTSEATDARGNKSSENKQAKGGLVAGADGLGAVAEAGAGVKKQGAKGFTNTADLKLTAGLTCDIKEAGEGKFKVVVTYQLGFDLAVGSGYEKEKAPGKGGVKANAGKAVVMRSEQVLDAEQTARYRAALEAESKGTPSGAAGREFEIIRTGAQQGLDAARALYLGLSREAKAPAALAQLKDGQGTSVEESDALGGGVDGNFKAVSVKAGVEQKKKESTTARRGEDGSLEFEQQKEESLTGSLEGGLEMDGVSFGAGGSKTWTTSEGLRIVVPKDAKNFAEMRDALLACRSAADVDAFAKRFPDAVERTHGSGEGDTANVNFGLGPAKLGLQANQGVKETVKTDGAGKAKKRQVVGESGRGGSAGIGDVTVGDSTKETATADMDADGNASLDLNRQRESNASLEGLGKVVTNKLDKLGKKIAPTSLKDVTGGNEEPDTKVYNVQGLKLSVADLKLVAGMALGDKPRRWATGCYSPRHLGDWKAARSAIVSGGGTPAAAAEALARYIGGSKGDRLEMVTYFLRPDGNVALGKRLELPDGLQKYAQAYHQIVIGEVHDALEKQLPKDGPEKTLAAAQKALGDLQEMQSAIKGSDKFQRTSVREEMLSAITGERTALDRLVAKVQQAPAKPVEDHDSPEFKEFMAWVKTCVDHEMTEVSYIERLQELGDGTHNAGKKIHVLQQWRDLHAVWWKDYGKLEALAKVVGKAPVIYERYQPRVKRLEEWEARVHIQGG